MGAPSNLWEKAFQKLDSFLPRSVRRTLGITMSQVRGKHITNKKVRELFFNIPSDMRKQVAARQLQFIGKAVRHPSSTHIPKQLISAWVTNKRPRGGVLTTNKKKLIVKALHLLYSTSSATDPFGGDPDRMDNREEVWEFGYQCFG
jgi:hypothetical protein